MKPLNLITKKSDYMFRGLIVLFFILFSINIPLNAQPGFSLLEMNKGNEFFINPGFNYYTAEGWQPKVAYGDNQVLVVWEDSWRDCIMGARVQPDGTLIDSAGIAVAHSIDGSDVCVASDGTDYFVVWNQDGTDEKEIYGARVSADGEVLDEEAIEIMVGEGNDRYPDIAFNGTNYLVAWKDEDANDSENIYAKRVSPEGVVLDNDKIEVCTYDGEQGKVAVCAGNNGMFFIVWNDKRNNNIRDIYGARMDNDGNVLDPDGFMIKSDSEDQWDPAVAFDGTNFFVVWDEDSGYDVTGIFGARVDTLGSVLDPGGFTVCDVNSYQETPDVTFDGTNYIVGWNDYRNDGNGDIYMGRVTPDAQILDPDGIIISSSMFYSYYVDITAANNEIFAVWEAKWSSYAGWISIFGTPISTDGIVQIPDGSACNYITSNEREPAIAFDGNNYLLVWQYKQDNYYNIYGVRIDPSGNILSPGVFVVSDADDDQEDPEIAFDGTNFFVVWEDYRNTYSDNIYGTFISTGGTVLNEEGFSLAAATDGIEEPVVAFDGDNYLVVYEKESLDDRD
ncbi:MAG: hypothetical protein K8S16_12365, partial [Bacteroidales bacterium]|nr:hypothetical protein [Bacteroidales bacterium]